MLKAIETRYKGYRFRSRLEARWAVFFDAVGLDWQYEPEGYELPSGSYLPDFYLPSHDIFVEVKGDTPSENELERCRDLRDASDSAVLLAVGLPYERPSKLFCWDVGESAGLSEHDVTWLFHRARPTAIIHSRISDYRDLYASCFIDDTRAPFSYLKPPGWHEARAARFEHGECGA